MRLLLDEKQALLRPQLNIMLFISYQTNGVQSILDGDGL